MKVSELYSLKREFDFYARASGEVLAGNLTHIGKRPAVEVVYKGHGDYEYTLKVCDGREVLPIMMRDLRNPSAPPRPVDEIHEAECRDRIRHLGEVIRGQARICPEGVRAFGSLWKTQTPEEEPVNV
jgi:hypothetical protein